VETLSIGFNDEIIKGFCLLIDARSGEEKTADTLRGHPAGPVIVFFQGHAQRPDDAYEFTSRIALLSRSGMVIIPVCDTPYGAKSSFHGDKGKDVILMEMVRFVLAREGMNVRGFVPVTSMPVAVNGLNLAPENDDKGARIVSIGWSHGGILARRFAHAYLHFSLDPSGHFLVLIRCSPYSDVKTSEDRAVMVEKFEAVLRLQEACVARGMADGSIKRGNAQRTTQAVQCCLVGAVRTMHLTPYSVPGLFDEVEEFIRSALTPGVTSVPCIARNLP